MKLQIWKIIFLIIVLVIIFFPKVSKIQKLKQRDQELSQQVESLICANNELVKENEMLKTDAVYIEEVAREKLKVARENEIVFRVISNDEE
ncbi:MAG: septum formation initiator family protein [Candidatus Omnitrophica bacterium]|nr:septum formation initiator family protein [Candidatus Omnitrophota bacterium]